VTKNRSCLQADYEYLQQDCRLFIEELDRGDSIGERGLDRLSMLNSQNNKRKLALCVSNELDVTC